MPEIEEMPVEGTEEPQSEPGPEYGEKYRDIPEDWKEFFKSQVQKYHSQDRIARLSEVRMATLQRFYWRTNQHLFWSGQDNCMVMAPYGNAGISYGGGGTSQEVDGPQYMRDYNIYTPIGRTFQSTLSENFPSVRFEPVNPGEPVDEEAAKSRNIYRLKIEREADMKKILKQIARLWITDGRTGVYCYQDDAGLNYGDENAGMTEKYCVYAQLNSKVPTLIDEIENWPYIITSVDLPTIWLKGEYDWMSEKIGKSNGPSMGEFPFSRVCRLAIQQGTYNKGAQQDAFLNLTTKHTAWLRSCVFEDAPEEIRDMLKAEFPDGIKVTFVGDVYAEAEPESICEHWSWACPMDGDGWNRPSLCRPLVDIQDAFNDLMNHITEIADYCVPQLFVDGEVVDIDARRDQIAEPGGAIPITRSNPQFPLAESFYLEEGAPISPELLATTQWMATQLTQLVSGTPASMQGAPDPDLGDTAAAYNMSHDAALGIMGPPWMAMQSLFASMIENGANLAQNRDSDIMYRDNSKPAAQIQKVKPASMQGNTFCYPEKDSAFPETWAKKRETLQWLFSLSATNPMVMAWLAQSDNQEYIKDEIGLELVIPGAESAMKQLKEIEKLLQSEPVPNEKAVTTYQMVSQQAAAMGKPVPPPPPPEALLMPSIPIDPLVDDNAAEAQTAKDWMISDAGQQVMESNPEGYMNVRLHYLAHMQAQADAVKTPDPKETFSVAYKDLPPSAQQAYLKLHGFDVSIQELMDDKVFDSDAKLAIDAVLGYRQKAAQPAEGVTAHAS